MVLIDVSARSGSLSPQWFAQTKREIFADVGWAESYALTVLAARPGETDI